MNEVRILLVEDEPNDVELTMRALRRNAITAEVTVARDGAAALAYLLGPGREPEEALPPLPSLVLLDLNLPKIRGLDVLRRLRQDTRTRLLPVVILTSSREEEDRRSGYLAGANSYIRKPVDFDEFLDVIRQLSAYWLSLNEPPPI
ncbi:MAG: response regulator [Gemmatimonadota bacterium]|nr:response regulator [Gemmatimonadota bacterium]